MYPLGRGGTGGIALGSPSDPAPSLWGDETSLPLLLCRLRAFGLPEDDPRGGAAGREDAVVEADPAAILVDDAEPRLDDRTEDAPTLERIGLNVADLGESIEGSTLNTPSGSFAGTSPVRAVAGIELRLRLLLPPALPLRVGTAGGGLPDRPLPLPALPSDARALDFWDRRRSPPPEGDLPRPSSLRRASSVSGSIDSRGDERNEAEKWPDDFFCGVLCETGSC